MHADANTGIDRIEFEIFPERPLAETEAILERLIAAGAIRGEPATADDLRAARIPASAGPAFRALARRFRSVTLALAEVRIELHAGAPVDDALGGWRFTSDPPDVDVRLHVPDDARTEARASDVILDATWSPRSAADVVRHSTIAHFLVRAAIGDGA